MATAGFSNTELNDRKAEVMKHLLDRIEQGKGNYRSVLELACAYAALAGTLTSYSQSTS